jgi:integrase
MTRIHGKLSAFAVKNTTERGLYADGGGLYLQIARNGSKSWILRYRLGGRRRYCGLGSLLRVTLAEARKRAGEARGILMDGNDPIAIKQGQRTAARLSVARTMTFAKAATQYIDAHRASWSAKSTSAQVWINSLKQYVHPVIGSLPVQDIDTGLVMRVIEPIWAVKTETASRIRGRIEAILDWAKTRGFRTGDNPATWEGHLENLLPAKAKIVSVVHHEAMPYADLPTFMAQLRQQRTPGARALEFTILTAARTGETVKADWSEIDLASKTWTIPAVRMKARKEHTVALSDAAVKLLTALPTREGFVFGDAKVGKSIEARAMFTVLQRDMGQQSITVHGFRSTFSDWAHECTVFPAELIEMALAHSVGSAVARAYRRGDMFERRSALMSAWADFCAGKMQPSATVTELRRA